MDETIFESIGGLDWDQITDVALLATIEPSDFQTLIAAYHEGIQAFRETWGAMVEEDAIGPEMDRGAFVLAMKASPRTESVGRYAYWCMKAVLESGEKTKEKAKKKSPRFKAVMQSGEPVKDGPGTAAAEKYMTPHTMDDPGSDRPKTDNEVMKNKVFHNDDQKKELAAGLAKVVKAEKMMKKVAATHGQEIDQAFPNLFPVLARERARNS